MKSKQTKPSNRKTKVGRLRTRRAPRVFAWHEIEPNPDAFAEAAEGEPAPTPAARSEIAQNIEALNSAIEGLETIRDAIGSYRARVRELEAISARFDLLV